MEVYNIRSFSTLKDLIVSEEVVVLDFYSDYCSQCREYLPMYHKLPSKYPSFTFGKVNIEFAESLITEKFDVIDVPDLIVIINGNIEFSSRDFPELIDFLDSI